MNLLYLHVGIDKTGTTAIQQFLHQHQQSLREKGLNYVQASRGGHYHHNRLWDESLSGDLAAWELVRDEVIGSQIERHVISHEGLYTLGAETLKKIRSILDGIDVKVIIYLRRQSDFVCSGLVQRVKQGQGKPLDEYTELELVNLGKDYERLLNNLLNLVGENQIVVRCYEDSGLKDHSVLEDFVSILNSAPATEVLANSTFTQDANPTPPVEVILGMGQLLRLHLPESLRRHLVNVALARFPPDGSTLINEKTLDKIDRKQARSNRRVAERWFGRRDLFVDPRKFSYRQVRPELEKGFWSCVWAHLVGYGLPAWDGKAATLPALTKSGHAISLERDDHALSIVVRLPAMDDRSSASLVVGFENAVKDALELSINGTIISCDSASKKVMIALDRVPLITQRPLVDLTIRTQSGSGPKQAAVTLEVQAS
jgi:hypothetical protein